jgi:UDPglucose 6-dehydrogenase
MGTTVRDFLDPEFVLLGGEFEDRTRVGWSMTRPAWVVNRSGRTSIRDAELIKVAYNTFIGLKIAFANTLMEICHKTGGDVDEVTGR